MSQGGNTVALPDSPDAYRLLLEQVSRDANLPIRQAPGVFDLLNEARFRYVPSGKPRQPYRPDGTVLWSLPNDRIDWAAGAGPAAPAEPSLSSNPVPSPTDPTWERKVICAQNDRISALGADLSLTVEALRIAQDRVAFLERRLAERDASLVRAVRL